MISRPNTLYCAINSRFKNLFVPISLGEPVYSPFPPRKKKREKGKKKGSDDSDSDDVEVIKEWNTSSRGRNGEGRNRRASVEERKYRVCTVCGHFRPPVIKRPKFLWCYLVCLLQNMFLLNTWKFPWAPLFQLNCAFNSIAVFPYENLDFIILTFKDGLHSELLHRNSLFLFSIENFGTKPFFVPFHCKAKDDINHCRLLINRTRPHW